MAKKNKTEKERNIEILNHKLDKENELIANYIKCNVSQQKIDALILKRNKHIQDLVKENNKPN